MKVTFKDLDYNMRAKIKKSLLVQVGLKFPSYNISESEFAEVATEQVMQGVNDEVKKFYAFLGDVSVDISCSDLYHYVILC